VGNFFILGVTLDYFHNGIGTVGNFLEDIIDPIVETI
jgi:hypothetical protein